MFRFLFSVRWIGFFLFVVMCALLFTRLGFWQFHRLEHRLDRNEVIRAHEKAAPVPLESVLTPGEKVDDESEWTRVSATGSYDVTNQLTVKFSTRDGAPGVDVVTPLVLESGDAVLIDRGWMETSNTMDKPVVPKPPPGEVTITGWMRQNNGTNEGANQLANGQVRAISSVALGKAVPYRLYDGYLNLRSESPKPATALAAEPEPELGQGPHLFYALQWWFFALLGVVGYVWFAVAEAKERRNPTRIDGFADDKVATRG